MFKVNELLKATGGCLISCREDTAIKGISIDSRTVRKGEAFIAIKGSNFDGHDFIDKAIKKGASCIIYEPRPPKILADPPCVVAETTNHARQKSWRVRHALWRKPRKAVFIKVKDTVRALGDIACFHRKRFDIPVIAVTGSNGKTTAKEMIAWVLSRRFGVLKNEGTKNNQIGLPMSLLGLNRKHDIAVLEIGTNHFGEVGYLVKICLPNIGVITNIGPAHLEHFHSLKGVFCEKYTLIENLREPYLAILNSDDALLRRQMLEKLKKPFILGFGIKKHADFSASDINPLFDKIEFLVKKYRFTLRTPGYYNVYNALVAIAAARIFGMEYKDIAKRLALFDFPQGRLKIMELNQAKFIDDTYNSNPASLKQALSVLYNFKTKGRKIFVMGDMLELGGRKELFHYHVGQKVREICDIFITVGRLSGFAAEAARRSGFDTKNIFTCASTGEARDILFNKVSLSRRDVVLVKGSRAMKMEEIFNNS